MLRSVVPLADLDLTMPLHNCFTEIEKVDVIFFTSHLFEANHRNSRLAKRHPRVVCAITKVAKMPNDRLVIRPKRRIRTNKIYSVISSWTNSTCFFIESPENETNYAPSCVYHFSCVRPETYVFLINWFIPSVPSSFCSLTRASITNVFFSKAAGSRVSLKFRFSVPDLCKMNKFYGEICVSLWQWCCCPGFMQSVHRISMHDSHWRHWQLQKEVDFRHRETRKITRIWIRYKNSHVYDMIHLQMSKKNFHNQKTHAKMEWRMGSGN